MKCRKINKKRRWEFVDVVGISVLSVLFTILFTLIMIYSSGYYVTLSKTPMERSMEPAIVEVDYINLNDVQKEMIRKSVLSQLKSEYVIGLKRVSFTTDVLEPDDDTDNMITLGYYDRSDKRVVIRIIDNKSIQSYKDVMCHELLHHQGLHDGYVIKDIASKLVCYND